MKWMFVLIFIISPIWAKPNVVDVKSIIKENYTKEVSIERDKIILSKDELNSIKQMAKLPVKSKLYRYYKVKSEDKIIAYAILITQKVRTKKATVLYFIENENVKFIEILAFLEPKEYIPKDTWMGQFDNKSLADEFKIGRDIPTISGSTMSARALSDGARLAIALYRIKLK